VKIFGLDFTSSPRNSKALTLAVCELEGTTLHLRERRLLVGPPNQRFQSVDEWLKTPGPWVAGIDFPFGQPRQLIDKLGWPKMTWESYVSHVATLGRRRFEDALRAYKASKEKGQKELHRATDKKADSRSPMKLENPPVGKMFWEGATRLLKSNLSIQPVRPIAEEGRVVIEAYPALVARKWIGRKQGYKNDNKRKCDDDMRYARCDIVHAIRARAKNDCRPSVVERYGLKVEMEDEDAEACVKDYCGDHLDSVLCAVQAAWAYARSGSDYGIPQGVDVLEGWIVDPAMT
jgi:hypothetical protein